MLRRLVDSVVRAPKYRHFKPRNQGVVRLDGKDIYLGPYNSPESLEKYHRLIAEWMSASRTPVLNQALDLTVPRTETEPRILSVNELLLAFWHHASVYYASKDGSPTELSCLKYSLRPVRDLYGMSPANEFGPKALKAVREWFIAKGICRDQINSHISRIRRAFRWAVAEQLVEPSLLEALKAVDGLRKGRSNAKESTPVKPVPLADVDATLPFVAPQIAAMIQVQRLTGMRPGEVVIMRPCDIEQGDVMWFYRPSKHKTDYLDVEKLIPLGPKTTNVLQPFMDRPPEQFLFSPAQAEELRQESRGRNRRPDRKTKVYPSELRAIEKRKSKARLKTSKRPKRERYDVASYRRAITYGIKKAGKAGVQIPHWHPHQLRHARATEVRKTHGIEGAQVALGHQTADVTQVYAERNMALAIRIAKETG